MLGVGILIAVLAVPYLLINLRRLRRGKPWAYTFCALGRDWEARMHGQAVARSRPGPPGDAASDTASRGNRT